MLARVLLFLVAALTMAQPAWAQAAAAGDRVALVIGNSAYKRAPLPNPKNDAHAMGELLRNAGFQVDQQVDTSQADLKGAIERFGQKIRDPAVKFGLFYYAGHGLQLDWRNYLVPVSADIRSGDDVLRQTVDVSHLLKYMEQAKGRSFLVILDACRDNPFEGYKSSAKGLSQFDAPSGSLLAYATAPGNVALDGDGQNGLYTNSLLQEFARPGVKVEDAFKRVRLNVRVASRGQQVPWESTSLEDDLYLFPVQRKKLSDAEQELALEQELAAWVRAKASNNIDMVARFLRDHPSGFVSELAQARLLRLMAAQTQQAAPPVVLAQGGPAERETVTRQAEADRDAAEAREAAQRQAQAERQAREAAQRQAELERVAREEAQRLAEAQRQAQAAAARQAEAERQAREAQARRQAEAERVAREEAARRQAEAETAAREAEAQRQEARARLARDEEARRRAETERLAREESLRQAEQARLAREDAIRQAEQVRLAREAEARRLAQARSEAEAEAERKAREEQQRQLAEAQQRAQEEGRRLAEAQRLEREAQARQQAEQTRIAQEEEARRAAETRRQQQAAARQAEQERLAREEATRRQADEARQRAEAERQAEAERVASAARAQRVAEAEAADRARQEALRQAEVARMAREQEERRLAELQRRQTEARAPAVAAAAPAAAAPAAAPLVLASTPFSGGFAEHSREYRVGDLHAFRVIDTLTRHEKPLELRVTAVDAEADRVEYNGGEYVSDIMGNTTSNTRGTFSEPRQFYPAELFVGKKWQTMFRQQRPNGVSYTYKYDVKVVARERITVPAGTFEAYRIEARGFNMQLGASLSRTIWVAPGVAADIAHETVVRLRNNMIEQSDRQELVSLRRAQVTTTQR